MAEGGEDIPMEDINVEDMYDDDDEFDEENIDRLNRLREGETTTLPPLSKFHIENFYKVVEEKGWKYKPPQTEKFHVLDDGIYFIDAEKKS